MNPVPNNNLNNNNGNTNNFIMGLGLFPALFTLSFTWDDIFGTNNTGANANNPEAQ